MIPCVDVRPELVAYLDGELEPTQAQYIQAHLVDCKPCRDELSALQLALGEIQNLPPVQPSAGFHRRFWQIFQQQQSRRFRLFRWLKNPILLWSSSLAAVASVVLAYLLISLPKPQRLSAEDLIIAQNLALFSDYETIKHLDLLADMDTIEALEDAN